LKKCDPFFGLRNSIWKHLDHSWQLNDNDPSDVATFGSTRFLTSLFETEPDTIKTATHKTKWRLA
jgi:hypothetical protein